MPIRFPQLFRRHLLIALVAFMLAGVQLLQASPLHDHTRHSVECALCHLQFGDDALVQQALQLPCVGADVPVAAPLPQTAAPAFTAPYQSRAPPRPRS